MFKKIILTLLLSVTIVTLSGCKEEINLDLVMDSNEYVILEGSSMTVIYTTNDTEGVTFSVDHAGIVEIIGNGQIRAIQEGNVVVTITSKSDPSVSTEITFIVRKSVHLTSDIAALSLENSKTFQVTVDSNEDVEFISSNPDIFVVDSNGLITAKNEGSATLTVQSIYDPETYIEIPVTVTKLITVSVSNLEYILVVDDQVLLEYEANDEVEIVSYNPDIVSVEGDTLTAVSYGTATVKIQSIVNPLVFHEVTVEVYKKTVGLTIQGEEVVLNGMTVPFTVVSDPAGAFDMVEWSSSDDTVLQVNELGEVTAVGIGTANIIARSTYDNSVLDVVTVSVYNILVVDSSLQMGDFYDFEGLSLAFGVYAFSNFNDAMTHLQEDTIVYVDGGVYNESFTIDMNTIEIIGLNDPVINGTITVSSDFVTIENLSFTDNGRITNDVLIQDFVFMYNHIYQISSDFIELYAVDGVHIEGNTFDQISGSAISLYDIKNGEIIIQQNTIHDSDVGVLMSSTGYDILTSINVFWNELDAVSKAFDIDLSNGGNPLQIESVFRFNKVLNADTNAIVNEGNVSDFTLNYWGSAILDINKFMNLTEYDLDGFYESDLDVLTEAEYDPTLPIIIRFTNPINEIMIGESHTFTYEILPRELSDSAIRYITVNPELLAVDQEGVITPLSSGEARIQIRSRMLSTIRSEIIINVITTPGIELTPSTIINNVLVGDSVSFTYQVFPYTHVNESVVFTSSNEAIASVDEFGVVTTLSAGDVVITCSLLSDPIVNVSYTLQVHSSLDTTQLLDYLTTKQVQYSTMHEWIAYGFQYNYNDRRYESVSRYYFDTVVINDSKMVPVSYGIRPGELMDVLPEEERFNEDNIHWVVVHDTASAATGSNALAHANYLYNNAINENPLWVSWHYTIDDHDIYQHLPEVERGYHAGDGSTNPGDGSYLGGGNRNGIGIEMSINDDGDMMRTWQRTAKLVVDILLRHDLPLSQATYHNDFSGKDCPNTLRNAGLIPLFEEFKEVEYHIATEHPDAIITFISHNPEYLDNNGRVHTMPERAVTVSYTITVTENGVTESRTFYTYLPGTVR